jgi:membrane protease YdiL (CAAX protease family)
MRGVIAFIRSVTPQDPYQALFLLGSTLLFICMQLRCFPIGPDYAPGGAGFLSGSQAAPLGSWLQFSVLARLPIAFAGAVGLFICFWPGSHGVRRIFVFVLLPAFLGIAAICQRFIYIARRPDFPHASVLEGVAHNEAWVISTVWSLGPAIHMSVLGFILVLAFELRLGTKASSLPICVVAAGIAQPSRDAAWKRILVFVWISITCVNVIGIAAGASLWSFYSLIAKLADFRAFPPQAPLGAAVSTAFLAAIAAWAVGEDRWRELRRFIRFPEIKVMLLGAIFPIAIQTVPNFLAYISDRIHWAAFQFGKFAPPDFVSYFYSPKQVYLWYLFAAAFEEIIWRGFLQPRFVQRFGLPRGIFLVGLAWSAFHFLGDFQKAASDYAVFLTFIFRISFCIAMSYVLGWLTLHSGSIWPAAISHGLSNVWALSAVYPLDGRQGIYITRAIITLCWGLLGFALFRYFPPSNVTRVSVQGMDIEATANGLDVLH